MTDSKFKMSRLLSIRYDEGDILEYDPTIIEFDITGDIPESVRGSTISDGHKEILLPVGKKANAYFQPRYKIKNLKNFNQKAYTYKQYVHTSNEIRQLIGNFVSQYIYDHQKARITRSVTTMTNLIHGMDHWYSYLLSNGFNKNLRNRIKTNINTELHTDIKDLRNIQEHWDKNQKYFIDGDTPKKTSDTRSVINYKKRHSGKDPMSIITVLKPHKIIFLGGIVKLTDIIDENNSMDLIVEKYVEDHIILGDYKVKY